MKHISILPLYDATLTSIDSSYQILTRVNDLLKFQQRPAYYTVEIVGTENATALNHGIYTIQAARTISQVNKTDVVIIPLLCGNFEKAILENKKYTDWLFKQFDNGAEIVCLCAGSFYLASTGLLNNRKCAVHWAAQSEFAAKFPQVKIIEDTIITDENGIYTCAGGYSHLNMLLYIIEKHLGREMSILVSKMFEIDIDRKSQNPFMIFVGQKQHGDELVLKVQEYMEGHPDQAISIDSICTKFSIGRRTFERRFKRNTGNSASEYIQRVKVELAKKQLELGTKTINEIIFDVGYNDADAFRKVFRKYTDLSPVQYRKKFAG